MEAAYSEGFVDLAVWYDSADIRDKHGKRTGRQWLRAELRRQAHRALTTGAIPHGPPTVWRLHVTRGRLGILSFVGPDRVKAGDLTRNQRRFPRLSTSSPCAVCGLPGLRVLAPPPPIVVYAATNELPAYDSLFSRTDGACPRHSRLVRKRLAYKFDPMVRG